MRNLSKLFLTLLITVLAPYTAMAQTVTSTANSGEGSLRQVIADAQSGSIIVFALEPGSTIRLNSQLTINKSLTLMGPGADRLTISGDSDNDGTGETRIFSVTDGTLTLRNLRLSLGSSGTAGAGVLVNGSSAVLNVADCEFTENNAAQAGGAIAVTDRGLLLASRTLFLSNFVTTPSSSSGGGGAIYLDTDREITIENCTFSQNSQRGLFASRGGGAVLGVASNNGQSKFNFINNTFFQNSDLRFAANISDAIMMVSGGADARLKLLNNIFADNGLETITVNENFNTDSKSNIADDEPAVFTNEDLPNTNIALGSLNKNGGAVRNHSIEESSPAKDFSKKPTPDFDTRRFVRNGKADAGAFETNVDINESPAITSTAPINAIEESLYTYNITVEDPEDDNLVIVAITKPDWLTFNVTDNGTPSPTARLTGTPDDAEVAVGSYAIVLQLTDGINLTRQEFTLTITDINDPPVLVNNNTINVDEGSSVTITENNLSVSDLEQRNQEIVYTVVSQPQNGTLVLNGNSSPANFTQNDINQGRLIYRHNNSETTSDSFRLQVSDGAGGTINTFTVNVAVAPGNDPPTLITNNGLSIDQGATATITDQSLLATDPDNTPAELIFTITAAPTNGNLRKGNTSLVVNQTFTQADINAGRISYRHAGNNPDEDFFRFILRDNRGGELSERRFDILVAEVDNPPVVAEGIPDQTIDEDVDYSYTIPETVFRDPGDILTYELRHFTDPALPAWINFDPATRTISGTPQNQDVGEEELQVIVTDQTGQTANTIFTLTIVNVNDTPEMLELNADSLRTGTPEGTLVGRFIVEDVDLGDSHTYTLVSGDGDDNNELFEARQNRLVVAPGVSLDTVGNYTIRVRVTDLAGAFIEEAFVVNVYEPRLLGLENMIYNLLTPGGTDDNNTWGVSHLNLTDPVKVLVLNRAGEVMFETTDPNLEWDGTVNGREAPDGTYYYVVDIRGSNPQRATGTLLLER